MGSEMCIRDRLNANQYKVVRLATEYDNTLQWFHEGHKSSAVAIARALDIHDSTAREWIRVGHALDELPLVHDAFARNQLSYAKTRIVTRWADAENEAELLNFVFASAGAEVADSSFVGLSVGAHGHCHERFKQGSEKRAVARDRRSGRFVVEKCVDVDS